MHTKLLYCFIYNHFNEHIICIIYLHIQQFNAYNYLIYNLYHTNITNIQNYTKHNIILFIFQIYNYYYLNALIIQYVPIK